MRLLLAAVLVMFWTSAAFAERRVALIFGADRYENMRPLKNAVNDARAIEDALEALNFEVFSERNRDLRRMRRALEDFNEDAAGADVAFVFFAGHGVEVAGDNRLLPTDADASSLEALKATSLALNELHEVVARVAETALIVLDACRDDPFGATSDPSGRGAFSLSVSDAVRPGLGRMGSADNTLFAFSAAPGETASDGTDGNSPFTAALTKYLDTEGLEIRSVLTLVQQEVYDRTRGRQLPYVESGLPSLFFANRTSEDLPERERLLLAMADIDVTTRLDVERVASETDVPLAPLYSALIGADLSMLDRQQRGEKLREAAGAFTKFRDELQLLRSGDERVTSLRLEAEEQLSLGAFNTARAKLSEAAEIDAASRETLRANLVERTLSEAATHYLNGGAARAELEYDLAISDYERAIALFDEIGDEFITPDARQRQLNALGALGRIYITIGNLSEAATAFEKQLAVSEVANGRDPDDPDLRLALALSQDNLGDVLFEQGRIADAFVHYQAGHTLRLDLAGLRPGDEDISYALSNSYERLGRIHHRQGDLAAAEAYYQEKYRLGAQMVAAAGRPGYHWDRDLSISDELLGDVHRELGDLQGAFDHYTASLDRMGPIRDANPDDLHLQRFTSITLDRLGEVLSAQGDLDAAMERFEESRALRTALVAVDPANVDWQYVLGISHERIGDVLSRMGDTDAATAAYEAKHEVATLLAEGDPTNVRWARDLSVADERLGGLAHNRGDYDAAIGYYRRSLDRMTPIRDASTDMELNRFLSFTQSHLADALMDKGDTDAALEYYRSSLELREELVATDPKNADWRFFLGVSHELVGNAYMRTSRPGKAVTAYEQELAVMSVLLEQDPGNLRWTRAVSITNELLGDAHLAAGAPAAALVQYNASLGRMSEARDANPGDLGLQRFTAVTLRKIGGTLRDTGSMAAAYEAYSESLAISTRLVEVNPQNSRWQRDLLFAYNGVSETSPSPIADIRAALEATERMKSRGVFAPSDQVVVDALRRRLNDLEGE